MKEQIIKDVKTRMHKSVDTTRHELSTMRTGKATPALLDNVKVDAYGVAQPLKNVATVNAPDSRMLLIQPWDKSLAGEIVKGIQREDLGLNPLVDGNMVRVPIPALNEERRRDLVKHCKKLTEDGKVAVRNVRRDANEHLKKEEKEKKLTVDDARHAGEEVQKLTDSFCHELDALLAAKEKELMEV